MVNEEMHCIYLRQSKKDTARYICCDPALPLQVVEIHRCTVTNCQFGKRFDHNRDKSHRHVRCRFDFNLRGANLSGADLSVTPPRTLSLRFQPTLGARPTR